MIRPVLFTLMFLPAVCYSQAKSDSADLANYLTTSLGLIDAIHTNNRDVFNDFFTRLDAQMKASNESMFQFMTDEVIPIRGRIAQLHAPEDLRKIGQSKYPVSVQVFHLEDGSPGSLTFSLNDEGKIDHLSLFVHEQICPNRRSKTCNLVERSLENENK